MSSVLDSTREMLTALGSDSDEMASYEKAITLVKIGIDTASAISSLTSASEANPTNAVTYGAAGAAQFIAGFARIISNVAQAAKLLTKPKPSPPAFAVGGGTQHAIGTYSTSGASAYYNTTNRSNVSITGNTKNISTGGHVGTPTLGIFGEAGAEWVGPNWMYTHPTLSPVFDNLEQIRTMGYVPAFAVGGDTSGTPVGAPSFAPVAQQVPPPIVMESPMMLSVLQQLSAQLSKPIQAAISNDQVVENFERQDLIETGSNLTR